jgi:hypothetical protein
MPRYFFHVLNDIESREEDGQEFPDLDAAKAEARATAADLIRDEIRAGRLLHPDHRIEIEDGRGHVLHVLRFGDLVAGAGSEERGARQQ